jgi:hypothetical protein
MATINNRFENITLERLQEIYDIVSVPVSTGLTIGTTTITGGTVGRILFEGTGNVLQESANLFWDNTNIRLGVGVTPTRTLHVQHIGTSGVTGALTFFNDNNSYTALNVTSNGVGFSLMSHTNGTGYISATSSLLIAANNATNPTNVWLGNGSRFRISNTAETSTYLVVANTGNILVNTTTDSGYKFDVVGSARITGALTAQDNIRLWNSTAGTTFKKISAYWTDGKPYGLRIDDLESSVFDVGGGWGVGIGNGFSVYHTIGEYDQVRVYTNNFNPTTGTGVYNLLTIRGNINQTGTANGITRGLYIAPNVNTAANYRAIESTIGRVLLNHNNGGNIQADYSLMLKGNNPRLRLADSAGYNFIIKTNRANGNLVFGYGWNNSIQNLVTIGTTSIQPGLGVTGISSSIGTALLIQNSSLSSLLTVLNTGNVLIGTSTDAGYKLDVNGTSAFRGIVRIFAEQQLRQEGITQTFTSSLGIFRFNAWSVSVQTAYLNGWNYEGFFNFAVNIGTSSTAVASAVLEVTSTTRGFLPPRMTTTQKNAIATPATGLVVYDNTTNKLCCYNGSTWNDLF